MSPQPTLLVRTLQDAGISQAELARRTGLSTKHVCQVATGTVDLSPRVALLLERELNVPAAEWLIADAQAAVERQRSRDRRERTEKPMAERV